MKTNLFIKTSDQDFFRVTKVEKFTVNVEYVGPNADDFPVKLIPYNVVRIRKKDLPKDLKYEEITKKEYSDAYKKFKQFKR